jgi:spermidine dehydrogenase
MLIQRIFGVLYVLAGIAKAFPQFEDVHEELEKAALVNKGSVMSGVSDWLAVHSSLIVLVVGLGLFVTGILYLWNRMTVIASIIQILMMISFITILHRLHHFIYLIDAPFIIVAVLVIKSKCEQTINSTQQVHY